MICKRCGAESPAGAKVCMMCGAPFSGPTICPKCGAAVEAQAAFCPSCGKSLNGGKASEKKKHTVRNVFIAIAVVLVVVFLFGGGESDDEKKQTSSSVPPSTVQSDTTSSGDSSKKPEKKAETSKKSSGEMIGSGDLGDSYVEIKGAELGRNYSDEKIIIITYSWTNNSDETTSAMVATSEQAFQDGIELDSSFSAKGVDFSNNSKDVRPGNTIDIKRAYVLTSDTSIVEFEVTEWISFTGEVVKMDFDPSTLD